MRTRILALLAIGLAACGVPSAVGDGGNPTTTTHKPYTTTTTTQHPTTTVKETTTTQASTTTTAAPTTTAGSTTTTTEDSHKWFVCKYVGTPGVDERLQTGDNPISVDGHSIATYPDIVIGAFFADAQGRSVVIAEDTGQPEPSPNDCPPVNPPPTTTTTAPATTTTAPATTTTTQPATTTTGPVGTPFAIEVAPLCPDGTTPEIEITFGDRPDLDGQTGTLTFSTGGSVSLVFDANNTTTIPYPASAAGGPVTMTYVLGAESVTRSTTFPEACAPGTTTTTVPGSTTTTLPGETTTTPPTTAPPTTAPPTTVPNFTFGAAATVCVAEVPTIRITFTTPAQFPELVGQTGTLTMEDINGNVVSTQSLVYEPGTTVDLLYPGTSVNPDGTIDDVPGWILTDDGFWIRDPSDEFLREGINLTYTVNPTATAFVSYPPESSTCANPDGPFPPGVVPPPPGTVGPPIPAQPGLPTTGTDNSLLAGLAGMALAGGVALWLVAGPRRRSAR